VSVYRNQALVILIGAFLPMVVGILYLLQLNILPGLDLLPFSFVVTGLAGLWALYRFRLLELTPIARAAVMENLDDAVLVLDNRAQLVDLNLSAQHLFELPAHQAIGRPVVELLFRCPALLTRFHGVFEAAEEIVMERDSKRQHFDLRISPLLDQRGRTIGRLVQAHDISERKRAEEALAKRDRLLESVARALAVLVTGYSFNEGVQEALRSLGEGADVDRVYIFENHVDATSGEVLCSQRFEWVREGITPQLANPALQMVSYRQDNPRWYTELLADRPIRGLVRDFPLAERAILEPQQIVSILAVPVRIEGRFWGFIGFDDCRQERQWNDNELAILTAVAGSIGGAISRQKTSETLQLTQFTVDHASTATYWIDQMGCFLRVNLAACRSTGYSAEELLRMRVGELDPAFPPEAWPSHWQMLQARGAMTIETTHRAKDGHFYPVEISLNYLEFQGTGYNFAYARDISERKQAEEELRRHLEQLRRTLEGTVHAFSSLLDQKDPYTAGHQKRVTELALRIGRRLGLAADSLEGLKVAGSLHDIGKITIPSEILSKPAKLNEMEMLMVQGHSQASFEILRKVEFPWSVAEIVLQHHERLDGSGYPRHLQGEQILLEARILMVADVMEAICSHRPYRPALGCEVGLEELQKGRGTSFDPQVVDACRVLFAEGFTFEGVISDG
ncbi:MAG: PAS domain S-box protein, partial [Chloroflexi bacterium]|nr:PAS domain S-box protein [Chloroflexota bacterium]